MIKPTVVLYSMTIWVKFMNILVRVDTCVDNFDAAKLNKYVSHIRIDVNIGSIVVVRIIKGEDPPWPVTKASLSILVPVRVDIIAYNRRRVRVPVRVNSRNGW